MRGSMWSSVLLISAAVLAFSGCKVATNDAGEGHDVDIRTPLGGMSVKTDSASIANRIGLPVYPGATPQPKHGDDNGSADVEMGFGSFHLRVLAAGYDTAATPQQVETYYRTALQQYSDVIECQHHQPLGKLTRTGMGLTCSDSGKGKDVHVNEGDNDLQLKAGSPTRQHIVAFHPAGSGTEFHIIALDLPHTSEAK